MSRVKPPLLRPHRSIRSFREEPLAPGLIEDLVRAGQEAATDATAQMYSFVRVVDRALRARMATLAGSQEHVARAAEFLVVCADVRRLARTLEARGRELGSFPATALHFATVDATLAAGRLIDAAEAAGLGTVCIGGILEGIEEIVEELALPAGVLPLFGLCLGWPAEQPETRPRVAVDSVLHVDAYRDAPADLLDADIAAMAAITRSRDWVTLLARYFAKGGAMEQRESSWRRLLARQGFRW